MQKNQLGESKEAHWRPSASLALLRKRAVILEKIRHFFSERHVLEVETPLLSHHTVTDPFVIGIPAIFKEINSAQEKIMYLQTSPEYAMKRLLAAGSGPIYQISKAFRQGDRGKYHSPEFTILEWYRPGFTHHDLMNEMDALLKIILQTEFAERLTYQAAFEKYAHINPHTVTLDELIACAKRHSISIAMELTDKNGWLDLLLTHCVEPHLGKECPTFLYDFPVSQAALAKIRNEENPPVASRFEVYFKGIELANGFHELQNAEEQRHRFEKEMAYRAENNFPPVSLDERFLAALHHGIPDCAGVALGIDRLIMLATQSESITESMSFGFEHA